MKNFADKKTLPTNNNFSILKFQVSTFNCIFVVNIWYSAPVWLWRWPKTGQNQAKKNKH